MSGASFSFQKQSQKLLFVLRIRLITDGQIDPVVFLYNTLLMTEGIKALSPMVISHAAVAHTAEGHAGGGQVNDRIVDAAAAEA